MKKTSVILIFILIAATVISIAACSDENAGSESSSAVPTEALQTEATGAQTEPGETVTVTESNADETTGTAGFPQSGYGYPDGYKLSPSPADDEYIKTLTFLGDSTTYHLKARGEIPADRIIHGKAYTVSLMYLSDLRIRTASETEDDYKTVSNYFLTHHPERLVVTVGLGGGVTYVKSGKLDRDGFMYYYSKLIRYIRESSPETTVMLQSIFPVLKENGVGADNDTINEVNSWIREFAVENGLYYYDTHSVLVDETGSLKDEYAVQKDGSGKVDGYHITAAGYRAILNYIIAYKYEG